MKKILIIRGAQGTGKTEHAKWIMQNLPNKKILLDDEGAFLTLHKQDLLSMIGKYDRLIICTQDMATILPAWTKQHAHVIKLMGVPF